MSGPLHILFVHQNYPAQFRHIAPSLASAGWRCSFVTQNTQTPAQSGVEKILYRAAGGALRASDAATHPFQNETAHARGVYEVMKARPDIQPDLVVAHSGFGSSLFLPYLYDAPIINFFEYYFHPLGQHLGYRPDAPVTDLTLHRSRLRNAVFLLDLDNCDRGWCPNVSQRDTLPKVYWPKIEVMPEGIDTDLWKPGERGDDERRLPGGIVVPAGTRLVTYVARGLERMRGFDIFMAAAKRIYQQFPDVLFVIVGGDKIHYSNDLAFIREKTFREHVLKQDDYDQSKFHFTGFIPPDQLAAILAVSDLHVYLTEPFVTSWSMLNAMSSGCVMLASEQACVREYIEEGRNGMLVDFFDAEQIAGRAVAALRDPAGHRPLGEAARRTIEEKYALREALPRISAFFRETAERRRSPSIRAELLRRPGSPPPARLGIETTPKEEPRGERTVSAGDAARGETENGEHLANAHSPQPGRFNGTIPWYPRGGCAGVLTPLARAAAASEKTVLFCWEMGAGLGHMTQMLPLARSLAESGCHVFVALSHLGGAEAVFSGSGVRYLQAPNPSVAPGTAVPFKTTASFAHVLANVGWLDERSLYALASAWRNLLCTVKPRLILFDHSPAALLASRGLPARRALIGSGFCCPPNLSPWPAFYREQDTEELRAQLRKDEERILKVANSVSARLHWPPLNQLGDLYAETDENFLTTFPELDHYPQRRSSGYWGPVFGSGVEGQAPEWPEGDCGRGKVFAYLKRSSALPEALSALKESGRPTLAYIPNLDGALQKRFQCRTLRVEGRPFDLARVVAECDAAVLNGGHGATAQMLLAGRPVFQAPLFTEQTLTAKSIARLGAGEYVPARQGELLRARLEAWLADGASDRCAEAAGRFAGHYSAFDACRQQKAMLRRCEQLLSA